MCISLMISREFYIRWSGHDILLKIICWFWSRSAKQCMWQSARQLRHLFQTATTPCRGVELVDSGGHPHPPHFVKGSGEREQYSIYIPISSLISAAHNAKLVFVN